MVAISSVNCKLQEFPLIYCYIHSGVLSIALSSQTTHPLREERKFLSWVSSCSIWQSALVIICIAATLLFTAFDNDFRNTVLVQASFFFEIFTNDNKRIFQCSVLMAIRERQLGFWLLSALIIMHAVAALIVNVSACIQLRSSSERTLLTLSFKDVVSLETFLWEVAMLLTGTLAVYQFVATYVCEQCLIVALEVSFVVIPLIISFLHPLIIVWNVPPLRDAAVRVFPSLSALVPEYALVPPPPTGLLHHFHFRCQQSNSVDGGLEKPKIITPNESPGRHSDEWMYQRSPLKFDAEVENATKTGQISY
ncbi:unnamed protein product [Toxocara canis]|uniref:G protein-coupled receptor n=1 Tax=Toxocara canis TaxID=6265 RepID=A0A183VF75_TOXCA|nr:unnamed protein product [Toxocara canis]